MPTIPPVWDLRDLYPSSGDPALAADAARAVEEAEALAGAWAGSLAGLSAEALAGLMRARENVLALARKPSVYARLLGAAGDREEGEALHALSGDARARVRESLGFVGREWTALPGEAAEALVAHPALAPYARELALMRDKGSRSLPPEAEAALDDLLADSARGRLDLYESALAKGGEASAKALAPGLQSPSRKKRAQAAARLAPRLKALAPEAGALLALLVREKAAAARAKGLAHPWEEERLESETGLDELKALAGETMAQTGLARRYLRLKARLLGLGRLGCADLTASMPGTGRTLDWAEAEARIPAAFARVSPGLGEAAQRFFRHPWIHARPAQGKEHGAFCLPTLPGLHPYLLTSWRGTDRCLALLAHELGHGVHQLMAAPAGLFSLEPPFPWAEAVACFFELALGLDGLKRAATRDQGLAALAQSLQSAFILVFRQAGLFAFEHDLHFAPGLRSAEAVGAAWAKNMERVYGAPARAKGYANHWILVPHFLRLPGKVGDYVPAGLIGLAMIERFGQDGPEFGQSLEQAMALGRTRPMADILVGLGLPAPGPELARRGLAVFDGLLGRAEAMAHR